MEYEGGDLTWILFCTSVAFLMVPGLGFFYSGMCRLKNSMSIIILCLLSVSIVSVEWFAIGYSLVLSKTNNPLIGDFKHAFLHSVMNNPSEMNKKIPSILLALFQCMFASISPAIVIGSGIERIRMFPAMLFILMWTIFVYNFIAYWAWAPNGWLANFGELDYAGSTPVHIGTGFSALSLAIFVGKREGYNNKDLKPHNYFYIILGTCLLWFGWLGFNGGSALEVGFKSILSCINTHLAGCSGGITTMTLEYLIHGKRLSVLGFCTGSLAAMITVTSAAGFIDVPYSLLFGFCGAMVSFFVIKNKNLIRCDDAMDVFLLHGICGVLGSLLTGVFSQKYINGYEGELSPADGMLFGNHKQLVYQLIGISATAAWSFIVTYLILLTMKYVFRINLRCSKLKEKHGADKTQLDCESDNNLSYLEKRDFESTIQ